MSPQISLESMKYFFDNYRKADMPRDIIRAVISGTNFKYKKLETLVLDFGHLKYFLHPRIKKVNVPKEYYDTEKVKGYNLEGYRFPIVRLLGKSNYFVYNPETGKCIGKFNIKVKKEKQ